MAGAVQDEENKTLDPIIYADIEKQVKELHGLCIANQGDAKMGNASCLQLLNEIEKNIDRYLQEFKQSEDIDQQKVLEEQKKIKQMKRKENRAL